MGGATVEEAAEPHGSNPLPISSRRSPRSCSDVGSLASCCLRFGLPTEGFIALPGGYRTIEEFSEVLTWGQLGLHAKPMGILNVSGYFDHFLRFLDHAVEASLLRPEHRRLVLEDDERGGGIAAERDQLADSARCPEWIQPDGRTSVRSRRGPLTRAWLRM